MEIILDRVGIPHQTKVEMNATADVRSVAWIKYLSDEELEHMQAMLDQPQERALLAEGVVDGAIENPAPPAAEAPAPTPEDI
jgi:hypothetical protein